MGKHKRNTAEKGYRPYGICGAQIGIEISLSRSTSKEGRN
jgi:hypothetical protein